MGLGTTSKNNLRQKLKDTPTTVISSLLENAKACQAIEVGYRSYKQNADCFKCFYFKETNADC